MNSFRVFIATLWLNLCCVAAPLMADQQATLQDCDSAELEVGPTYVRGPACTISWVDNNRLQTIVWRQVEDDFQEVTLHQGAEGYLVLVSSRLPELIDVDQDGWLDLTTFTQVGSVNGTFVISFYDPVADQFDLAEPVSGHTLERDKSGYLVVTGRSGPGWSYEFYELADGKMTFLFEVEPFGLGQSGDQFGDRCDVTLGYKKPLRFEDILVSGQIPDAGAFFTHYCDTDPDAAEDNRRTHLQEIRSSTDRVPASTVFYCVLEGNTHAVFVTRAPRGLSYVYGRLGDEPELVLDRPSREVRIRPQIVAGQSRSGDVTFRNGAHEYAAYYSYELPHEDSTLTLNAPDSPLLHYNFTRGLVVYKDGDTTAPVFQRECILKRSYDALLLPSQMR